MTNLGDFPLPYMAGCPTPVYIFRKESHAVFQKIWL